jgi:metallo-beta-lactamase class B
MKKLGLDPAEIKYVVISHGHGDHSGGVKYLQDYHARIVLSPADWDLLARDPNNGTVNPKREMEATDGQKLTLGDITLTLYITPGHTSVVSNK